MRSTNNDLGAGLKIIAALLLLVLTIWLCASRADFSPRSCVDIPDPADTAEAFFSALSDGRYEDCDALLYNYSSLGLASSTDAQLAQYLYDLLRDSYSYTVIRDDPEAAVPAPAAGDVSATDAYPALVTAAKEAYALNGVSGKDAVQAVRFTHLDFGSLTGDLHARAEDIAYEYAYQSIDINDEETATQAVNEALYQITDDIGRYYRTDIFAISMKYVDGEWKIVLDDALYRAIIGNIA